MLFFHQFPFRTQSHWATYWCTRGRLPPLEARSVRNNTLSQTSNSFCLFSEMISLPTFCYRVQLALFLLFFQVDGITLLEKFITNLQKERAEVAFHIFTNGSKTLEMNLTTRWHICSRTNPSISQLLVQIWSDGQLSGTNGLARYPWDQIHRFHARKVQLQTEVNQILDCNLPGKQIL